MKVSTLALFAGGIFALLVGVSPVAANKKARRPKKLTIVSYNVLATPMQPAKRVPPLLRLLAQSRADIIALQEVAPWFLKQLVRQPWFSKYHATRFGGAVVAPNGQMVLSRFPIKRSEVVRHPGPQRRAAVIAWLDVAGDQVAVGTIHLDSPLASGPVRAAQLRQMFARLNKAPNAILVGDFNFGDGEQPDSAALDRRYVDLWTTLHPRRPGYTWDIQKSVFAKRESFPGEPSRRLDRILVRWRGYKPSSIRIIGNKPLNKARTLFPSDHFGLIGRIKRK